jgi:hypothetical protein
LYVEVIGHPAADAAVVIGDAVHNLRCALDHMAVQIATEADPSIDTKQLYFPFAKTRDDLIGSLKGVIKVAGRPILDVILDKIKPYERPDGNSVLYALSALDNDDKHNLLTPSVSIARIDGISGFDAQHGIVLRDQTVILAGDTQMGVIGVPGQFQIADHGRATAEIVFAKEGVLQGQAVLPALCQLLQIVAGAVQAIEDTYRA